MSTSQTVTVDTAWYLGTYPDVAAAGIDPQRHYELYGRAEGRLPRPLRALSLENALWGGFSQLALPELQACILDSNDSDERASAALALARWYASHEQWHEALPLLEPLQSAPPPWLAHIGPLLLSVEVLLRTGLRQRAQDKLRRAIRQYGELTDFYLAAANACLPTDHVQYMPANSEAELRLAWINRAFLYGNLAPVSLRNPQAPLSLDNLDARPQSFTKSPRTDLPKISVIMPAFNAAAFIETALRSLLTQSWHNLEVLVVDDCSEDETCELVAAMAQKDARIILLRRHINGGAYAARNDALHRATGAFLVNHDSDDWSHPQRLERMVQPLLSDDSLVGMLADWVRTDKMLHFQHWRIVDRLIEPSVSTLMVRKEAVLGLGGWDEVRVAADHELHQRLIRIYGNHAIGHVLPGVPLVLARQLPTSLTMASSTHLRSLFFGLRHLYNELAKTWHTAANSPADLYLLPAASERAFSVPAPMLQNVPFKVRYDHLLIADLSVGSLTYTVNRTFLERLLNSGAKVALFHWPNYFRLGSIDPLFLGQAIRGTLDLVLAEQQLDVENVWIIGRNLLEKPLDRVPQLRFNSLKLVDDTLPLFESTSTKPDLFVADWYLQRYPDVRAANIDPWQHYINYGAAEGRDPSPTFNTVHYLTQAPEARDCGTPPLLHYDRIGRYLGYDPNHPFIRGQRPHLLGQPILLLCAHAAEQRLFGAERCFLDVLDACIGLKLNVLVSVPSLINTSYISALQARSFGVTCVPHIPWQENSPPCALAVKRFLDLIQTHKIDLVQANTLTLREPLLAARQAGIPSVVHIHESPAHDPDLAMSIGLPPAQIIERTLANADLVLANSAFTALQFEKSGAVHIVSNIVDEAAFDLPNIVNPEAITAALISSNLPKKGLKDLEILAVLLARSTPNIRLLLIGPCNEYTERLRRDVKRGKLPRNLDIVPYSDEPQSAIAQTNIVLNLSTCQETFGRTALEGLAAGRPVLAYGHGALPELIEDGLNGFLIEPNNVQAAAVKLRELCFYPKLILQMGEAGRRSAKRYNQSLLCRQLERAYQQVLSKKWLHKH